MLDVWIDVASEFTLLVRSTLNPGFYLGIPVLI
jgi:hypothetical protein